MSAEIQESINNFKVIIVFNRLDYFRKKFSEVNDENYKASINSGIASNVFSPIYNLSYSIAQLWFFVLVFLLYHLEILPLGYLLVSSFI